MWFKRSAWKVKRKSNIHTTHMHVIKSTLVKFGSSTNTNSLCPMFVYFLFVCSFKTRSAPFTFSIKRCCGMVFLVNNLLHLCQTTALNWGDISIPPVAKPGNFLRKEKLHSRWRRWLCWWRHQLARSNVKIYVWSSIYHYCLTYLPLREIHHYVVRV